MKQFKINVYTNNNVKNIHRIHYVICFEVSKNSVFGFKILMPISIINSK